MVKYEYRCPEHGVFEALMTFGNPRPQAICPECGTVCLRHYATSPIIYKVGGFYTLDNRKEYDKP